MAYGFDGSTQWLSRADNTLIDLPNSEWCIVLWMQKPTNTGTSTETFINNNGYAASSRTGLNLEVFQDSHSQTDRRKKLGFQVSDSSVFRGFTPVAGTAVSVGDSIWRVVVAQRIADGSIELRHCEQDASASVLLGTIATGLGACTFNVTGWDMMRTTGAAKYANAIIAETSVSYTSLTDTEIVAIASGLDITDTGVRNPAITTKAYNPLVDDLLDDSGNSLAWTNNGTVVSTTHPYNASSTNFYGRPSVDTDNTGLWTASAVNSVTGITRSSNTATVNEVAHGLIVGDVSTIAGADQSDYNGGQTVVAVTDVDNWTFTVANTPTTPATGTITSYTLFDKLDEVVVDDTDFITSPVGPSNAVCKVKLTNMLDPGTNAVKLIIRHQKI